MHRFSKNRDEAAAFALLCLLILILGACRRSDASPEESLRRAVTLYRSEDYAGARREVDRGIGQARTGSPAYWDLQLQRAEIVYAMEGPKAAQPLLTGEPPADSSYDRVRARRKLDLGWVDHALGDYADAAKQWDAALAIAKHARDDGQTVKIEFSQVRLLGYQQRWAEAEGLARDANRLAEAMGDRYLITYGLGALATALIHQNRFEDALSLLNQQAALFDEQTKRLRGEALHNTALCLYRLGETDRSLAMLQEAGKITRTDLDTQQAIFGTMGNIYRDRGDSAEAKTYYLQALKIATELKETHWVARWLGNLARISIEAKDWGQAGVYDDQAFDLATGLKDQPLELQALNTRAMILKGQRNSPAAEKLLLEVSLRTADAPVELLDAHSELAELYADQGLDKQAEEQYQAALAAAGNARATVREDEFKVNFFASLIRTRQNYIDFLMSRGKNERALEMAEASRARILQERLGIGEETSMHDAASYRRLAHDSDSVLLSYWLGPKRSYVWVTTPEGVVSYTLPPQEQIRSLVEKYRALEENMHDPLESDDPSGRELYETLLAPVLDRIRAGAHLIIAPDGPLHALNFESLPIPTPKPHYFIEDATISVAPSLNLVSEDRWSLPSEGTMLMIGDADSSDENYPNLPYAPQEIALVLGHFPASRTTCYRRQEAVPEAYEKAAPQGFTFVHFAAHASTNRLEPLDSAIMLSGPAGKNKLTAREVVRHPLQAKLVTISACRSAGARTFAGEGLVGFMWAFFRSGAKNIIAGLWEVSDDSTPRLMNGLYTNLMAGKPPSDALRAAKLALLRPDPATHSQANPSWSRPFYWAPFQLYIRETAKAGGRRARAPG